MSAEQPRCKRGREGDVQILETGNDAFDGKFATFKDDATRDKYVQNWDESNLSLPGASGSMTNNHKSIQAKQSGELCNSGLQLKSYDGALSKTDNVPNHIDFTSTSLAGHYWEAIKAVASPNANIGADNAKDYKEHQDFGDCSSTNN